MPRAPLVALPSACSSSRGELRSRSCRGVDPRPLSSSLGRPLVRGGGLCFAETSALQTMIMQLARCGDRAIERSSFLTPPALARSQSARRMCVDATVLSLLLAPPHKPPSSVHPNKNTASLLVVLLLGGAASLHPAQDRGVLVLPLPVDRCAAGWFFLY